QDRYLAAGRPLCGPDPRDTFGVPGEVTVREIESRDVQPRPDQPLEHFGRFRGRPDSRDDFRFVVGQRHRSFSLSVAVKAGVVIQSPQPTLLRIVTLATKSSVFWGYRRDRAG